MIANARMYSVSPQAAGLWRALLSGIIETSGLDIDLLEHTEPAPIDELWRRSDMAGVFMCGLPLSLAKPRPQLIAAPVPSPDQFRGLPKYWSEFVVRRESTMHTIEDTFGGKIALTVRDSQSGCVAALYYLMLNVVQFPPYSVVIEPCVTPLGALSAVIEGAADVAPIDAYALVLLQKYRRDLTSQVRVVARTAPTAIPPLVASAGHWEPLQRAFCDAHENPGLKPLMDGLLLERFVRLEAAAYDTLRSNYETAGHFWRQHALGAVVHPEFDFR